MKAKFKPKLFTKKEWQNNRSSVCKGSGVGKALEAWQKNCPGAIVKMTKIEVAAAYKATKGLESALAVAAKKCNKKFQKDTLAGIGAYKSKVTEYQNLLRKAMLYMDNRRNL